MIIDLVVGARPNFVKAAAILNAAKAYPNVKVNVIHTGQHKDVMSDPFFKELELPVPLPYQQLKFMDAYPNPSPLYRLGVMMEHCGSAFETDKPDYVMVVGDTDSTLAGALAAAKTSRPLIHVEAGLRLFDGKIPEETNRILVDSVSDLMYTTTDVARDQLISEGHDPRTVKLVGNVMIDTLYRFLPKAFNQAKPQAWRSRPYAVLTLHRTENLNNATMLGVMQAVERIAQTIPVVFPVHPRTHSFIGGWRWKNVQMVPPKTYLEFIALLHGATFVMTDSGGVQEETTALGIKCFTLREETERPETVVMGSNTVVGTDPETIEEVVNWFLGLKLKPQYPTPFMWDGHAADRIMADLAGGILH